MSEKLYGKQTELAVENFPISGQALPFSLIKALAQVKQAAAQTNAQLGAVEPDVAAAIEKAAEKVIEGDIASEQFPVDVYQTGSGTSTNMNLNEVLANLASKGLGKDIHPNDQVNASQSTNDAFPTAIHIAAANSLENELIPALSELFEALATKAEEFKRVVKSGRTHLMDATPVTLGQEFGGYAASISHSIVRLSDQIEAICEVAIGGTAVGTGLNAPKGYPQVITEKLAEITGLPIREALNHFEAQGTQDSLVELSGVLKTLAVSLTKICNDLRWMSSGPTAGLGEINLPELQAGSSIMPGKVNPVIPEAVLQVCSRVVGNDASIAWAGASGNFELNVQMPIIGASLLESIELLAKACRLLAEKCVSGITANVERNLQYAKSSPAIATALNPLIGYDKAAQIAKQAVANHTTIKQAALNLGFVDNGELTDDQLDEALDPIMMC